MGQPHKPDVPRRRTRRIGAELKTLILVASREEFQEHGFAGATTAAIARRAGVTETQIFRMFRSKADLFREAVFEPLDESFAVFNAEQLTANQARASSADDPRARQAIRDYIAQLMAFIEKNRDMLVPLLAAQLVEKNSVDGVGAVSGLKTYFEIGAKNLARNSEGVSGERAAFLVRASFAAVLGSVLLKDWLFDADHLSDEAISTYMADFMVDGIGPVQDTTG